jgi:beta-lactamase class A
MDRYHYPERLMTVPMFRSVCVLLSVLLSFAPQELKDGGLSARLKQLAAPLPGVTGIAIVHVQSGTGATLNADDWFPMMSVYKLPIVVHALRQADAGALSLSTPITLTAAQRRPGRSALSERIAADGPQTLTVRELIEWVVRESDNAASDTLLRTIGGPAAVSATLRSLGGEGINVNRYELEFAADYYGVCCLDRMKPFTLEQFAAAVSAVSPADRRRAAQAYVSDRRDSATPRGMATFARRLQNGELLSASSTTWLLEQMHQMRAVAQRIAGDLPAGTPVARRPGTSGTTDGISAAHNETGIITLPGGRGHLVVSVFIKGAAGDAAARDKAIARIGRAAYDWALQSVPAR